MKHHNFKSAHTSSAARAHAGDAGSSPANESAFSALAKRNFEFSMDDVMQIAEVFKEARMKALTQGGHGDAVYHGTNPFSGHPKTSIPELAMAFRVIDLMYITERAESERKELTTKFVIHVPK